VRLHSANGVAYNRPTGHAWITQNFFGPAAVEAFSISRSGDRLAIVKGDPKNFPDIYLAELRRHPVGFPKGEFVRLTKVNPQADTWKLPQIQYITWKGADGVEVGGILELPPDYKPGQKVPLVVEIHGGPTTAMHQKLQYWIYGRTLL